MTSLADYIVLLLESAGGRLSVNKLHIGMYILSLSLINI